ncbi:AAA+ ATPase superfamily predicted ATPase [Halarchaeum rubridurum]|uniref:AAA+ ATPase superfamily predicted ATPase n=1 Tax=Halarchaeum rubridurum TaxID=489911 RepID=A0A8T4GKW1_9EURY|nr:AAA+ ATPase superfamily predicted ATPase [Halarchaeum rubridurum]
MEATWVAIRRGELGPYSKVGRWWYGEDEIDVVGLEPSDDRLLLAECKWTTDPVGLGVAESLREKAGRVRWGPNTREEEFALFSKSGFADGLADELDDSWSLFNLEELDGLLA